MVAPPEPAEALDPPFPPEPAEPPVPDCPALPPLPVDGPSGSPHPASSTKSEARPHPTDVLTMLSIQALERRLVQLGTPRLA
jgi:hypothetical protein